MSFGQPCCSTSNFAGRKTFEITSSSTKSTKLFHLETFYLYGIYQIKRLLIYQIFTAAICCLVAINYFYCVNFTAEIVTHPQSKLVSLNRLVNLMCTSSLSSNVIFSWTHNGTSLNQSSTTGDTSILTITNVRQSDTGSYVCTVSSGSVSVMSNSAILSVYGKIVCVTMV